MAMFWSFGLLVFASITNAQQALFEPSPLTFGSNGFANWADGRWPRSHVGRPLVPQSTDSEILNMLKEFDPSRIQNTIQTLVDFGTRHTCSNQTSKTRGIGAARRWLLKEMKALAAPSNGRIKVSLPCYHQRAEPEHGLPLATKLCNVQAEIKGGVDPNRMYVYTGHYDSRRLNVSDFEGDAPGADDNASAVAIALEMVRILARHVVKSPPAASIIIAAVAGEEQNLYGSNFLAETLKNASVDVQGNFNNDIVGSGSNAPFNRLNQHTVRVFGAGIDYLTLPKRIVSEIVDTGYENDTPARNLGRFVQEVNAGAASTTKMQVALIYKPDRFFRGGDHMSFLNQGFSAIRFTEPEEDFYHQHQDPRTTDGVSYGDNITFVDSKYTARVGRVNLLALWNIANAPSTPRNFTYDAFIGFLATNQSTPAAYLENVCQLYWNVEDKDPLLDHYEVVWRATSSQQWTHMLNVGMASRVRIHISKDNVLFGLRAVGKDGKKSPAQFAKAVTSEYFG